MARDGPDLLRARHGSGTVLMGDTLKFSLALTSATCERHPSTLIADMLSKIELAWG
jgi:hypothetical protein